MVGKQQLNHHFPGFAHIGGIRPDNHSLIYRIYAGRNQTAGAFDFDHTHPAGPFHTQFRMIAQRRHFYSQRSCRFQNSRGFRHRNLLPIDCYINHFHYRVTLSFSSSLVFGNKQCLFKQCYPLIIDLNGHLAMQAPHLMHLDKSISC